MQKIDNEKIYFTIVEKENSKYMKYTDTEAAKLILSDLLKVLGYDFKKLKFSRDGKTKKPYFKNSKIKFNYSHSKKYIACVVSIVEVGIDIEEKDRIVSERVSKKYLSDETNKEDRIEEWVKKEAYSKMNGMGIKINFKNLDLMNINKYNIVKKDKDYVLAIYADIEKTNKCNYIFEQIKLDI